MNSFKLWTVLLFSTLLISCVADSRNKGAESNTEISKPTHNIAVAPQELTSQLPPPPQDFIWKFYHNAVFSIPKDWNEAESTGNVGGFHSFLYAASPEEFSETKQFEMGITVNVMTGGKSSKNLEADKIAAFYIAPTLKNHKKEEILRLDIEDINEDTQQIFFRYKDSAEGQKTIIVHKFILSDKKTDSVYVFIFESPEDTWKENWEKYGTPFLKLVTTANVQEEKM